MYKKTPSSTGGSGKLIAMSGPSARAYGILDEATGSAHRGLFIIYPEGVLRYQVVTDMNVGLSVEETLRILQALQADGLCPANWKPGQKLLG